MNEANALLWMVLGTVGIYGLAERLLLNYVQNHLHLEVMQLGKEIKKANEGCKEYLRKRLFLCRKMCWKQYKREIKLGCRFALLYQMFMVHMIDAYTIWGESETFMKVMTIWTIIGVILVILVILSVGLAFWDKLREFLPVKKQKSLEEEPEVGCESYIAQIIIGPLAYVIAYACIANIGFIPNIMKRILPHIVTASLLAITIVQCIILQFNSKRMQQIKIIEKNSIS